VHLIIDGNNLAWAGYYALERAMKPEDELRKGRVALLGVAGGVLGAIARRGMPPGTSATHELTHVTVAFDDGRPLRRRQIYPAYQTGRERDPKFIANEPIVLGAIAVFIDIAARALPVDLLRSTNVEADDLIAGSVARRDGTPVRIVSTDRDFLQLVGPGVDIYSPVKRVIVDEANFDEQALPRSSSGAIARFPRDRFLQYRTLLGDPSDDLPGVPGIGPLTAAALVARADARAFVGDPGAVREAIGRKSLAVERAFADGTAEAVLERNEALMDLRRPSPVWDLLDDARRRGAWDAAAFSAWLDELRPAGIDRPALLRQLERLASTGA
jgi:5'-3' exonuclease